ncbi:hypothetical protein E8E13_009497 [Curvularia kusanoi]|uniref:Methyltransferase type 11 domain-containing protein n=1 Tax=Curvularia kusanoi TaxID=90978 RepID=A0A9P4TFE2_CURKU|nr:hypothetical protein E8E13_009497 [Curvularia kusanoi]
MVDTQDPMSKIFDNGAAAYEASTGGCTRDLTRHMLALSPPISSSSVVHDNACGTGIVTQEIITQSILSQSPSDFTCSLAIHCTDKSENMIQLARSWFERSRAAIKEQTALSGMEIGFEAVPSEQLRFEDGYFTHSFTNCGILWFDDGLTGAREILRTLRSGGTAVISSWKGMTIFDVVREAQKACGHQEPLFRPPVDEKWFTAEFLEKILREAGFIDVQIFDKTVHFAGNDVAEVCAYLLGLLKQLKKEWDGDEGIEFRKQLEIAVRKAVVRFSRPDTGGKENLIGIPMVALVAVARKQ